MAHDAVMALTPQAKVGNQGQPTLLAHLCILQQASDLQIDPVLPGPCRPLEAN
jgi:hypothetical protein